MKLTWQSFFIVCPLVFIAGFIDSIAGGGGLISLPAYLFAGLPPHNAIATNKLSSCIGTTISCTRFIRNKCVDFGLAFPSVIMALIGSALGAQLALLTDEKILKGMLIIVLPIIAFFVLQDKDTMESPDESSISRKKQYIIVSAAAFFIGGYDGFYGPGTGAFLVLIFTSLAKLNIKIASGNTKCINLASNVAALITFLLSGKVVIALGLAGAVFSVLGNYIGSGLVLKNGAKIVRPIIIVVLILLFIKVIT